LADDTIQALNNPALSSDYGSADPTKYFDWYNGVTEIDLNNNDLWHIPFFGYAQSQYSHELLAINNHNFDNLAELDLQNNHITHLPLVYQEESA
jgi:Leucine-rich repeat (LRR) protein